MSQEKREGIEEVEQQTKYQKIWKEWRIPIGMIVLVALVLLAREYILVGNKLQRQTEPLASNLQQETKTEEATSSPISQEYPVDTENDGVYTNYEYGFRFEYPEDKFEMLYPNADNDSRVWIYQKGNINNGRGEYIFLSTVQHREQWRENYERLYSLDIGQQYSIRNENFTKLDSRVVGDCRLVIASVKTKEAAETEHVVGYEAIWLTNNDLTFVLNFYTDPDLYEKFLAQNKYIFDDIVGSFEFIN